MFGTALPILYPLALLQYTVLYITECLMLCYYYKQPPSFDEKLTMSTLEIMLLGPALYMSFSYWYLSNKQIFSNVVIPMQYADDAVRSGHALLANFSRFTYDQSAPVFIVAVVLLALVPTGFLLLKLINWLKPGLLNVTLRVDEDLSPYFDAVDDEDRNFMITEEENMRNVYVRTVLISWYRKLRPCLMRPCTSSA